MHGTKDFLNDFPRLFLAHSRSLGGNNMVVSMILGITDNERAIFLWQKSFHFLIISNHLIVKKNTTGRRLKSVKEKPKLTLHNSVWWTRGSIFLFPEMNNTSCLTAQVTTISWPQAVLQGCQSTTAVTICRRECAACLFVCFIYAKYSVCTCMSQYLL